VGKNIAVGTIFKSMPLSHVRLTLPKSANR